jgi:hypothetical protein
LLSDGAAVGQIDPHLLEVVHGLGAAERAHGLLGLADLAAAAGQVGVDELELLADLAGGDAEGGQPAGIELDADLAIDAAGAGHGRDALHAHHLLGDDVLDKPGELLLVHGGRGDHVIDERAAAGDVDALDDGVEHVLGQVGPDRGHGVAHVVGRALDVHADVEFDRGGGDALVHRRIDMMDAAETRDRVLDPVRDLALHLRRRGAGLGDGDRHQRVVDVGARVHPELRKADQAAQGEDDEQDDDRNRIPDRPGGNPGEVH